MFYSFLVKDYLGTIKIRLTLSDFARATFSEIDGSFFFFNINVLYVNISENNFGSNFYNFHE